MAAYQCDIVTPAKLLYANEAELVVVPGIEGEMGFLRGHEPLVSVLADGDVRIKDPNNGEMIHVAVQGGYVQVSGHKVIILADRACAKDEIDVNDAQAKLSDVEAKLSGMTPEEAIKTTLPADKAWYEVLIKVASAA